MIGSCSSLFRLLLISALLSTINCRQHTEPVTCQAMIISPTDTILVLDADTLTEILSIGEFQLDHGRVLILDNMERKLSCIELSSGISSSFGFPGEAPGGLMTPVAFISGGGFVRVVDVSNGMVCFDSAGEYRKDLSYFDSNLPLNLRPAIGSDFIGLSSENSFDENNALIAEVTVGLFEDSPGASIEYCSFSLPLDLEDIGTSTYQALNSVCYAADESDGDVFISFSSTDRINVRGYRTSGDEFTSIEEECERVGRQAAEIESEIIGLESHPLLGRFASMIDIGEYEPQVASIGVDSLGQVWLETASSGCPAFLVLSHSLEDTVMTVIAPALNLASSCYDIRIGSSGIIVCETCVDGGAMLYRMAFDPE